MRMAARPSARKPTKLPSPLSELVNAFPRQALHARLPAFRHPATGELMRFEANVPQDMAELMAGLPPSDRIIICPAVDADRLAVVPTSTNIKRYSASVAA